MIFTAKIKGVERDDKTVTLNLESNDKDCPDRVKVALNTFNGVKSDKIFFSSEEGELLKKYDLEPSNKLSDIAWYFYPSVKWVFRLDKEELTFTNFVKNMCMFTEQKDDKGFVTWSGYDPSNDSLIDKSNKLDKNGKLKKTCPPKTPKQLFQTWKMKYIDRLPKIYGFWQSDIINTRFGLYRNLELIRYNPWALHTLDVRIIEKIPGAYNVEFGREIYQIAKSLNTTHASGIPLKSVPEAYHKHLKDFFIKVIDDLVVSETQIIICKHVLSLSMSNDKLPEIKFDDDPMLNDMQNQAVRHVCNHKYTLVTGGAGVGKTLTIKKIVETLQEEKGKKREGWLVAIAGKAVQRIKEVVGDRKGCYYATIHSAINNFSTVCMNPHFIIIDEISMCSLEDLSNIMDKLPKCSRLAMFGDQNQLPPITGKNIFQFDFIDLESSKQYNPLEAVKLTQSYRSNDGILNLCQKIVDGNLVLKNSPPFFIFNESLNYNVLINYIDHLKSFKADLQFQVITPYVDEVAKIVKLIKSNNSVDDFGFFPGEKILVDKNYYSNYKNGTKKITLANGEIGKYISKGHFEINGETYSTTEVSVTSGEVLTIHKVQGSEFDIVIYWNPRNTRFITKELLYTAFSRAKSKLILFGEKFKA